MRGTVKSLGADCIEKEMRDEHRSSCAHCSTRAGLRWRSRYRRIPPLRLGAQALQFPRRQRRGLLTMTAGRSGSTRRRAIRPHSTIHRSSEIRRAAATGIYDIRGGGAKRKLPHFDDLLFLGASIIALSARGLSREVRHRRDARARASPRSRSNSRSRSPSPA